MLDFCHSFPHGCPYQNFILLNVPSGNTLHYLHKFICLLLYKQQYYRNHLDIRTSVEERVAEQS